MTSIVQQIRKMLAKDKDRQFILGLTGSELTESGLGSSDRGWVINAPRDTRERMEAMARSLGLAPEEIGRDRWREMEMAQACSQCGDLRTCRKYLDGKPVSEGPNTFCPNFQRFQDLLEKA